MRHRGRRWRGQRGLTRVWLIGRRLDGEAGNRRVVAVGSAARRGCLAGETLCRWDGHARSSRFCSYCRSCIHPYNASVVCRVSWHRPRLMCNSRCRELAPRLMAGPDGRVCLRAGTSGAAGRRQCNRGRCIWRGRAQIPGALPGTIGGIARVMRCFGRRLALQGR